MTIASMPGFKTTTLAQHDTNTFDLTRAIHVVVGGSVAVEYGDGTQDTFTDIQPGIYPYRIVKLLDTGTDAGAEVHGIY